MPEVAAGENRSVGQNHNQRSYWGRHGINSLQLVFRVELVRIRKLTNSFAHRKSSQVFAEQ
jgi:hypothetical protein